MPDTADRKATWYKCKKIWMPAAFMAFAIIVSVDTPGNDDSGRTGRVLTISAGRYCWV